MTHLVKNKKITVQVDGVKYNYITPPEYVDRIMKLHHPNKEYEIVNIENFNFEEK